MKKKKPDVTIPLAPLFFTPHFKEKLWGGRRLATLFDKPLPEGLAIGESWELSPVEESVSTVSRGELAGTSLDTLFHAAPEQLVGTIAANAPAFPLLIKFIDASDRLSVQVHPDQMHARERFNEPFGKTECWYIAEAGPSGSLALGLNKEVTGSELRVAAESGTIEQLLNCIPVTTGEVYFVPAGTVHAILNDVVIYEVQQNSDTTLRLYDWRRTDVSGVARPLQIDQAVAVADRHARESYLIEPLQLSHDGYRHYLRVACPWFALEEFVSDSNVSIQVDPRSSCRILTFIDGGANLSWESGICAANKGDTVLLPAVMGSMAVAMEAGCRFLMTTVPDLQNEIVQPLEAARYTSSRIAQLMGDPVDVSSGDR